MNDWFIKLIAAMFGGHIVWEVQCTDHQGCYRLWSNGIPDRASAIKEMNECVTKDKGWIKGLKSKWRIERKLCFSNYTVKENVV
jgi:hypothetical protein